MPLWGCFWIVFFFKKRDRIEICRLAESKGETVLDERPGDIIVGILHKSKPTIRFQVHGQLMYKWVVTIFRGTFIFKNISTLKKNG